MLRTSIEDVDFRSRRFDIVVAWGVVFLGDLSTMSHRISLLRDLLTPEGRAFLNFRTEDNWFNPRNLDPQEYTYCTLGKSAGPYADMQYSFLTQQAMLDLLDSCGLVVEKLERYERWIDSASKRNSWWAVQVCSA